VHCIIAALHHSNEALKMMNKIEQLADNLKAESRLMADRAVASLRSAGLETAQMITRTKRPVHAVADTGLKFNTLSHKSIEKLVKQQIAVFDDLIDGSARRLEMAARAKSMKTLVEAQIAMLPKSRDHALANAKKTAAIVRDTGDAFSDLFKDVVVDLSAARPGRKPGRKKKAAGRPAARKAVVRKPRAKKAAARKPAVRKAAPKAAPAPAQAA
jgi:hypothetical protein